VNEANQEKINHEVEVESNERVTVAQLMAILSDFPQDAYVFTEGYESGLDYIIGANQCKVLPNERAGWWDGLLAVAEVGQDAVLLRSTRRKGEDL
jgi:hypothetical protein